MKSVVALLLCACALVISASEARADIVPELGAVPVDGVGYRAVEDRYERTAAELAAATQVHVSADAALVRLIADDASMTSRITADTAAKDHAATELAQAHHNLKVIAVESYIRGNQDDAEGALDAVDEAIAAVAAQSHEVVFGTVRTSQVQRARDAQSQYDAAVVRLDDDVAQQTNVRTQIGDTSAARTAAAADEARLTDELARRTVELAEARATATVVGVDFTLVALDAYYRAAAALAETRRQCGIPWWALAGISRIEGKHGQSGGSELLASGDTTRPIIGIPLDGNNGTQLIGDTDGGELDGDIEFDRAVGPMQFIPGTWRRWATDGNGDGRADPHNIYDAALSAARYLCSGGPMQTDEQLAAGFLRYNHSGDYALDVLSFAHQYAASLVL